MYITCGIHVTGDLSYYANVNTSYNGDLLVINLTI